MSSEARKDFDEWFVKHYEELVHTARRFHDSPRDLVHHTYLQCINALESNQNILENLPGYFHTSMWNQAQNLFRKLYEIHETPTDTLVSDYDISEAIKREEAMIMANHLPWFDRTVLSLYLDGWSMAQISRESGINVSVLYESISKSKNKLRHVISKRTEEK